MEERQRHFVLVHGACHGAWCWYKVVTLLKSAGHKVTALDLAASGVHPKQVQELRSISDYFEPLMKFMMSLPAEERVILVGHSFGGLTVSIAMERFPEKIYAGVFTAAIMPGPDFTYTTAREEYARRIDTYMDTQYTYDDGPNNPPASLLYGPNFMSAKLYQLSPPEDLILGMMLIRPNRLYSNAAIQIEAELTKERHGSVPRIYVVCGQDNIVKEDLQRWMIQENPPDEVKLISDSDHMVMFSKPQELCSYLKEIANKYF
ncbi:hypothetical protein P3X46_012437 [Hevea brasiliensis]|uniref:AB hydrolase-1 domain-containing protein n=2 Tax=Hevea brasiliensis TaxID=3981 RepID=A0ABQ9MBC1_HEVBR|nr:methyl jasmonate esterase 1 [Hevea brasiliensis]KAJ9177198.1 hypothetical protein P3X46_012437 [Hevea brasiliensis]